MCVFVNVHNGRQALTTEYAWKSEDILVLVLILHLDLEGLSLFTIAYTKLAGQ